MTHLRLPVFALALLLASAASYADGGETIPPAPADPAAPSESPEAATTAEPAFESYVAVTTADEVRVRAGPSADFRVLDQLKKGSWVTVVGKSGEFSRVRVPGGVPVFVSAELVRVAEDGRSGTVAKADVLMRPTAGQEYFPLENQKLQEGDVLTVLGKEKGESGEWLKVLPSEQVEYFVSATLLERVAEEGEKAADLARITLERRDGYTGGREAEAAREALRKREEGLAALVDGAARSLAKAPAATLPDDAGARRADLQKAMTESGEPGTRGRAARVSRDYLARERDMRVADAKAEKAAVAKDLEARLAAVEADYRRSLADLLQPAPRAAAPRYAAIGTVRCGGRGGYDLVKGNVVLHTIDSLRYDLAEVVGKRVGVSGKEITVDAARRLNLLRVDSLEILD